MNNRKRAALRQMDTEALRNVLGSLSDQEASKDKAKYPLAGLVHLTGIGQVPVDVLRAELDGRERQEARTNMGPRPEASR